MTSKKDTPSSATDEQSQGVAVSRRVMLGATAAIAAMAAVNAPTTNAHADPLETVTEDPEPDGGGTEEPEQGCDESEQEMHEENSSTLAKGSAVMGGIAAVAGTTGNAPVALFAGIVAAGFAFASVCENDLANDPPQMNYAIPVTFDRYTWPTTSATGADLDLEMVLRSSLAAAVTGFGLLDAIERRDGALISNDRPWADMHQAMVTVASGKMHLDVERIAHWLAHLASSASGMDPGLVTSPAQLAAAIATARNGQFLDVVEAQLLSYGMRPAEITRVRTFMQTADNTGLGSGPFDMSSVLTLMSGRLAY